MNRECRKIKEEGKARELERGSEDKGAPGNAGKCKGGKGGTDKVKKARRPRKREKAERGIWYQFYGCKVRSCICTNECEMGNTGCAGILLTALLMFSVD